MVSTLSAGRPLSSKVHILKLCGYMRMGVVPTEASGSVSSGTGVPGTCEPLGVGGGN